MKTDIFVSIMQALTEDIPESSLPDADCHNCVYDNMPKSGGHCYMFSHPPGDKCGQFDRERVE